MLFHLGTCVLGTIFHGSIQLCTRCEILIADGNLHVSVVGHCQMCLSLVELLKLHIVSSFFHTWRGGAQ